MEVYIESAGTGDKFDIKINPNTTVRDVKTEVGKLMDVPDDALDLTFNDQILVDHDGKTSEPLLMSAYDLQNGSIVQMVPKWDDTASNVADLPSLEDTNKSPDYLSDKATKGVFGQGLYVTDPQLHYELLNRMEQDIRRRSKEFQSEQGDPVFSNASWTALQEADWKPLAGVIFHMHLRHLLRSSQILSNVKSSLDQMLHTGYCGKTINIIVSYDDTNVVEIKRIPTKVVDGILRCIRKVIDRLYDSRDRSSFHTILTDLVLPPCLTVLKYFGEYETSSFSFSKAMSILTFLRKTILLIDNGVVSYSTSHGPASSSAPNYTDVLIDAGEDKLAFRNYWAKLDCLDGLLGNHKVRVFHVFNQSVQQNMEQPSEPLSVLSRISDLADIWGPVYIVPTQKGRGRVKYYGISEGVVYPIEGNEQSMALDAIRCHYITDSLWPTKDVTGLPSQVEGPRVSDDALLLIGARVCENQECHRTLADSTEELSSQLTMMGTKKPSWHIESRSGAVTFTRIIVVIVTGIQKRDPGTTHKQQILNTWATKSKIAHPAFLDEALGVEISHCTGNGRRLSLRELMTTNVMQGVLDRQYPTRA
ncbi:MAG: hypothetical protein Q9169_006328 [Polycauliona sp. 2 TL-2023]